MNPPILKAHNLHKHYNGIHAVRGISLQIAAGEIYSLLGPNGAGKTTTIGMLTGLLTPSQGSAEIGGFSVTRQPMQVKRLIGVVPQEIALYEEMTARENLAFWGRMSGLHGHTLQERIESALELAQLNGRYKDRVSTYSGGMKRRLNIAIGLLNQPQILFLDEPTVGIDPQSRRRILDTVVNLNAQGLAVLYTTHYMEEAQELSQRIGIIDHGELIAEGSLSELTQLVGELESVHISLDDSEEQLSACLPILSNLPQVVLASAMGTELVAQCQEANDALPPLLSTLTASGLHVRTIEIQEPNLETVFLHLTGRGLRD